MFECVRKYKFDVFEITMFLSFSNQNEICLLEHITDRFSRNKQWDISSVLLMSPFLYYHSILVQYGNLAYGYCLAGMSSDISEAYGKLNVYVGIPGAKNNKGKKCIV